MKTENMIIAIVAFGVWFWMWKNAEKVNQKMPWFLAGLLAWLFHLWLAATWVANAFAAFGV